MPVLCDLRERLLGPFIPPLHEYQSFIRTRHTAVGCRLATYPFALYGLDVLARSAPAIRSPLRITHNVSYISLPPPGAIVPYTYHNRRRLS